jgi:hypothetical protein
MIYFVIAIIILVVLLAIFKDLKFESSEEKLPYKLKSQFFNKSEEAMFFELKKSLPSEYHIFPKVRIIDFIEPTNREYQWRNRIWSRHVDFLICDKYFKPIIAIEVNGSYHNTSKQQKRDMVKKEILDSTSIPLVSVNVGASFANSVQEIKLLIDKSVNQL